MSKISRSIPYQIIAQFGPSPKSWNGKDEVIYYCPECESRRGKPDHKGKLYVNCKTLKYHCFLCGYSGQIGRKVKYDSSKIYEEDINSDLKQIVSKINELEGTSKFKLKIPLSKVTTSDSATSYLLQRGFTYDQMEYYDLRVGNLDNEFGRIIIPNEVNRKVYADYYTARSYIGQIPKYHNPCLNKSSIVYNLHRVEEESPIILVEGPLTAIAAGKHAVATLGKTITSYQAGLIASKRPSRVYVNYDYGAETYLVNACRTLRKVLPTTPIYMVFMKDDRDAADLTREEYVTCLSQAVEYKPLLSDIENIL